MGVGSTIIAILPFCQDMKTIALHLQKHVNNWVVKLFKETPQRQYSGDNTPLDHNTDCGPVGLGQYYSLGEYCGPHTASSVSFISTDRVDMVFVD